MILIVDNGMFSNTINYFLKKYNFDAKLIRSTDIDLEHIENFHIKGIVVSNGIDKKENINNTIKLIQSYAWKVPILGIGIGAVAIGVLFNAKITDSRITNFELISFSHDSRTIFNSLSKEIEATKWCKYAISNEMFNKTDLEVSARKNNEILAFRHRNLAIEGILFDITPVSCIEGEKIIVNFLNSYFK